jgi:hypothetical protein
MALRTDPPGRALHFPGDSLDALILRVEGTGLRYAAREGQIVSRRAGRHGDSLRQVEVRAIPRAEPADIRCVTPPRWYPQSTWSKCSGNTLFAERR